jgi:hypothetical protein
MSILSAGTSNTTSLVYTGDTTGNLAFQINGTTEAMRITSGGNVGIGTASPRWDLPFAQNAGRLVDCNSTTANVASVLAITAVGTATEARAIISLQNLSQTSGSARMVQLQAERTNASTTALDADFVVNVSKTGTLTERMRIDSSGRVTMPSQPAFQVIASGSITSISGVTKITFPSVTTNIGSSFSTTTSRFTAPVAGTYFLTGIVTCATEGSANYVGVIFYKNGSNFTQSYSGKASGQYSHIQNSIVVTLSANDYIEMYTDTNSGSIVIEGGRTYFMGYLLG